MIHAPVLVLGNVGLAPASLHAKGPSTEMITKLSSKTGSYVDTLGAKYGKWMVEVLGL